MQSYSKWNSWSKRHN